MADNLCCDLAVRPCTQHVVDGRQGSVEANIDDVATDCDNRAQPFGRN